MGSLCDPHPAPGKFVSLTGGYLKLFLERNAGQWTHSIHIHDWSEGSDDGATQQLKRSVCKGQHKNKLIAVNYFLNVHPRT